MCVCVLLDVGDLVDDILSCHETVAPHYTFWLHTIQFSEKEDRLSWRGCGNDPAADHERCSTHRHLPLGSWADIRVLEGSEQNRPLGGAGMCVDAKRLWRPLQHEFSRLGEGRAL